MIASSHLKQSLIPVILIICLISSDKLGCAVPNTFSVIDYGAVGDGKTDDTQSFKKAWEAACNTSGSATMSIPQGKTFLVGPSTFSGPCKASSLQFRVSGNITAPGLKSGWGWTNKHCWLEFTYVNGLTIKGSGTIDGYGSSWWNIPRNNYKRRPMAIGLKWCNGATLRGLTIVNSQKFHVYIASDNAHVSNLNISSPFDSPNTDGIHVQDASGVTIDQCFIKSGDDCVSVGTNSFNIRIRNITCGPGHGISIGSLGKNGSPGKVDGVSVKNVNFNGSTNGARIKTWQGGSGYARNIMFEQLKFNNTGNPIVIDQYYCGGEKVCENKQSAVKISEVSYIGASGSSATDVSIKLACSKTTACTNITLKNVNVSATSDGKPTSSYCSNAETAIQGMVKPFINC